MEGMELITTKNDLLSSLKKAQSAIGKASSYPLLSHVYLGAIKNEPTFRLAATNLETGIIQQVPARTMKSGACTADARRLQNLVHKLPDETVVLSSRPLGEGMQIDIKSGKSHFSLQSLDPAEFPVIQTEAEKGTQETELKVPGRTLLEMIEKTKFCVSTDEARLNLRSLYLEVIGLQSVSVTSRCCIRMASSDGHRLSVIERRASYASDNFPATLIPFDSLPTLTHLLSESKNGVILKRSENTLIMTMAKATVSIKLGDKLEFPDYKQIIPKDQKSRVTIAREMLVPALSRIKDFTSPRSRGILLDIGKGTVMISAKDPTIGEATEEVEVLSQAGLPAKCGFNVIYLEEIVRMAKKDEEITILIKDEVTPAEVRVAQDTDFVYVIMPMRV